MKQEAQEYLLMMNELEKLVVAFKGYNGSKEHMKMLDDCTEKGKAVIKQRTLLPEDKVEETFGVIKEMIIKRHKAKNAIVYLEKCIEAEKHFISSLELEKSTIQGMKDLFVAYDNFPATETPGLKDEEWESLIQAASEKYTSQSKKFDKNELSHNFHNDQISLALSTALQTIEEIEKRKKKE